SAGSWRTAGSCCVPCATHVPAKPCTWNGRSATASASTAGPTTGVTCERHQPRVPQDGLRPHRLPLERLPAHGGTPIVHGRGALPCSDDPGAVRGEIRPAEHDLHE